MQDLEMISTTVIVHDILIIKSFSRFLDEREQATITIPTTTEDGVVVGAGAGDHPIIIPLTIQADGSEIGSEETDLIDLPIIPMASRLLVDRRHPHHRHQAVDLVPLQASKRFASETLFLRISAIVYARQILIQLEDLNVPFDRSDLSHCSTVDKPFFIDPIASIMLLPIRSECIVIHQQYFVSI